MRVRIVEIQEALPQVARGSSVAEQVYHAIRGSIADGRLAPGSRVTERELAAALNVSPTPVREAIGKLEHEGLMEHVSLRRLQITDHPLETLRELMEVEVVLRGAEARFAARKITAEGVATLRGYISELVASGDRMTPQEQFDIAQRFDVEVARTADNPALRNLIDSYSIYGGQRRVRAAERMNDPEWRASRLADHVAITDALEAHDEDAAERLMREHARPAIRNL